MITLAAPEVADRIRNARSFPNGGIVLTDTVRLRNLEAPPCARTSTPGRRLTFVWRGPSNVPVIALENCRDLEANRIDVLCETPCEAVVLCERTSRAPGTIPSTMMGLARWRVYGNGLAARGFWYRATIDENNEHGAFSDNAFSGVARPFVFEGQQSKHHRLVGNVVERFDVAVSADTAFHWSDGTIAVGRLAFELTRVGDPVMIECVGVEATQRLLVTSGPSTDAQPILVQSVRYGADQLHEDGAMILLRHAGPLTILGGAFGDGTQRLPRIQLAGIGEQAVNCIGAKFGAFGADAIPPLVINPGVRPGVLVGATAYQRAAGAGERTAIGLKLQ